MFINEVELGRNGLSELHDLDTVSTEGAALLLGLSPSWLHKRRLRQSDEGPRFMKLGRRIFYRIGDLRAWQDANLVGTWGS